MKKCKFDNLAHLYAIDNDLPPRKRRQFEAHVETCPSCENVVKQSLLLKKLYTEAPFEDPSDIFERKLIRSLKIMREREPRMNAATAGPSRRRKIAAIAACIVLCILTIAPIIGPKIYDSLFKKSAARRLLMPVTANAAEISTWTDSVRKVLGYTQPSLQALDAQGRAAGSCPLKHTDVQADISGFIARVTVTQEYENTLDERIEAVYVFPLSQNAAVNEMTMQVGERRIRGVIKPRKEARQIYEAARSAGHIASLLEQERANIFTQSVANIRPGEKIKITISYVEYLDYKDGLYEFVFPMVVGPRYIPGNTATGHKGTGSEPDTDRVPDASRITPPITPEGTRAGHDISLRVNIDAGFPIRDIKSLLHEAYYTPRNDHTGVVELKDSNTISNKDFILRYKTAGREIETALLAHTDKNKGGFFTLIIQPPEKMDAHEITPKEMIFVIDTSGSMMGEPIEKAKQTMRHAIKNMNSGDSFQLIEYSMDPKPLFDRPQPNTPENREKANQYLDTMTGEGGTEMLKAMNIALKTPPDPTRLRIVCFMTDGYVGNDPEIISAVKQNIGGARLFSFGVGDSVNRYLLDEMARMGRGEVDYVTLVEDGKTAAEKFYKRINSPALTDIRVDWGGLPVKDVYPEIVPDLFASKPLILKGRYDRAGGRGTVHITGKTQEGRYDKEIPVILPADAPEYDTLGKLWARERIARLSSLALAPDGFDESIQQQITQIALEFGIMTEYTSFVAVEEMVITQGGKTITVPIPVEMPEGVSYDGIFGEEREMTGALQWRDPGISVSGLTSPGPRDRSLSYASQTSTAPAPRMNRMYESYLKSKYQKTSEKGLPDNFDSWLEKEYTTQNNHNDKKLDEATQLRILNKVLSAKLKKLNDAIANKKDGKGNFTVAGLKVVNWKLTVIVRFTGSYDKIQKQMKKAGFKLLSESVTANIVVGELDVRRLENIATIKGIEFIEPL